MDAFTDLFPQDGKSHWLEGGTFTFRPQIIKACGDIDLLFSDVDDVLSHHR
jgi:hypothetical protein